MDLMRFAVEEFSKMQFSWVAFCSTVIVVLVSGIMSVDNKKQWAIVVAELILFPAAAGMTTPYFHLHFIVYVLLASAGFIISWGCHKSWSPEIEKVEGFEGLYCNIDGKWWRSMELPGWLNLFYMTAQITMIGAYLLSPQIPAVIVRKVWYLLLLVSLVAVIKPAMIEGWRFSLKSTVKTAVTAVGLWIFIALATWIKLSMK